VNNDNSIQYFKIPSTEDSSGFFIPTLNNTGYVTTQLDIFSQAFVEYAAYANDYVLEVGAGYGFATLAALSGGAKIMCNDIEPKHLAFVEQQANAQGLTGLTLKPGAFPYELNFPSNYFSAILICRVLHLFDGKTIEHSIQCLYNWLKPKGKIFIVVDTPYAKNFENFISEYEHRMNQGDKWPGLITDTKQYVKNLTKHFPKLIHLLDISVLTRVLLECGFKIEKISNINRTDYPIDRRLDGRESIGAIAYKL